MRLAYERYSGPKGFTPEQFYQVMGEVAGTDLRPWFQQTVESTEELDYAEALAWYGLRFKTVDPKIQRAWTGLVTRVDAGRLLVSQVRRGTPAFAAGLNVDDEIIAIDDIRIRPDGLPARLEQYKVGDQITVLVSRRDRLMRLPLTLAAEPGPAWRLEVHPQATDDQKKHLAEWLLL
jgi:predicted metalloprotease with PDZ domain